MAMATDQTATRAKVMATATSRGTSAIELQCDRSPRCGRFGLAKRRVRLPYLCRAISKLTFAMLLGTAGPEGPTSAAVNKFSGGGGTRRPAIAERRFPEQRSKALMKWV